MAATSARTIEAVIARRAQFQVPLTLLHDNEGFDLVILGRRGMGEIRDALFGAVFNHVLHHVRCPVLLI